MPKTVHVRIEVDLRLLDDPIGPHFYGESEFVLNDLGYYTHEKKADAKLMFSEVVRAITAGNISLFPSRYPGLGSSYDIKIDGETKWSGYFKNLKELSIIIRNLQNQLPKAADTNSAMLHAYAASTYDKLFGNSTTHPEPNTDSSLAAVKPHKAKL